MPPDAQGDAVDANNLPQAAGGAAPAGVGAGLAPQHPVWAAAAGRGGGSSKPKPDSMFKPISMMELEIRGRGDLDGGSSTASMRGGYKANGRSRQGKRSESGGERKEKKRERPREYDDDDDDDDDDGAESSASLDMAGAAFGGATAKGRAACASEASDDGVSVTSSVARQRHERAFPITGVTCVGCALPAKIQPVTDFITKNMSSMSELALYKMAALVYKTKVADPAEEEGVDVPVRLPLKPKKYYISTILPTRSSLYRPIQYDAPCLPCLRTKGVGLEGGARALPTAFGRPAHASVREHSHALGHAQDARNAAAALRSGDGRAVARQAERRVHHEDHPGQQPRAHAARRGHKAARHAARMKCVRCVGVRIFGVYSL